MSQGNARPPQENHPDLAPASSSDPQLLQTLVEALYRHLAALTAERQRADAAGQESKTQVRLLLDAAFDGMILHDERTILTANQAYTAMSGYDQADLQGRHILDLVTPESRAAVVAHLLSGTGQPCEVYGVRKHGDAFPAVLRTAVIPYQGQMVHVTILRDPPQAGEKDRQRTRKQNIRQDSADTTAPAEPVPVQQLDLSLVQIQKLESLGRLAGGMAHEFNNLLTVIMGFSKLGIDSLASSHPVSVYLEQIHQVSQRAADLIQRLLAFARRQKVVLQLVNFNDLLRTFEPTLRSFLREDIEVVYRLTPSLEQVRVNPGQVEQMLINLAVNARDAMPSGGALTLETANAMVDAVTAEKRMGLRPGPYVTLTVRDTGCGMSDEVKAHLFEPFFTTKEVGQGTGLGLAACYGILKQNDGYIAIDSAEGQGTTVTTYWPHAEETLDVSSEAQPVRAQPAAKETVLLVEDESDVRALLSYVLQGRGYTVLEAANGLEALQVIESQGERAIDLVVSDVVMPQMSGKVLRERLLAENPHLKVLLISGYTADELVHQGISDMGIFLLHKPFTPDELVHKVQELLADGSRGGQQSYP